MAKAGRLKSDILPMHVLAQYINNAVFGGFFEWVVQLLLEMWAFYIHSMTSQTTTRLYGLYSSCL